MRVLISGVAGFIGSHLADALLEQGHEVVGVDNYLTGHARNLLHAQQSARFLLSEHDVVNPLKLTGPLDRIYHLASPSSPVAYANHRVATMKVNSHGTCNLLDLAIEKGARFLVASTGEVYGEPLVSPQREDYWGNVNAIGLNSAYEESKRFAEAAAMAYHRERDADTRIARIFNIYGPRMSTNDGRVITNFIVAALRGAPLAVYGDGAQTRSFCFISDLVEGLIRTMEADFIEPVNLGNCEEVSILQLARDVLQLLPGTGSEITFQPAQPYDPRARRPDLTRARQILNWVPAVSRQDGLSRTVEYYRRLKSEL